MTHLTARPVPHWCPSRVVADTCAQAPGEPHTTRSGRASAQPGFIRQARPERHRVPPRNVTWWHDDGSEWESPSADTPTVWDDDPNPVIGVILGPDGEPLLEVRAQPQRRIGFAPPTR
jgi:hypothetical protein